MSSDRNFLPMDSGIFGLDRLAVSELLSDFPSVEVDDREDVSDSVPDVRGADSGAVDEGATVVSLAARLEASLAEVEDGLCAFVGNLCEALVGEFDPRGVSSDFDEDARGDARSEALADAASMGSSVVAEDGSALIWLLDQDRPMPVASAACALAYSADSGDDDRLMRTDEGPGPAPGPVPGIGLHKAMLVVPSLVDLSPGQRLLLPSARILPAWGDVRLCLRLSVLFGRLELDVAELDEGLSGLDGGSVGEDRDARQWEFVGSRAEANRLLGSLMYQPAIGFRGDDCLLVELLPLDQDSTEIAESAAMLLAVGQEGSGRGLADARVGLRQGGQRVLDAEALSVPGVSEFHLRWVLRSVPAQGRLLLDGRVLALGDEVWQHELLAGSLFYQHRFDGGLLDVIGFEAFVDMRTMSPAVSLGRCVLTVDVVAQPRTVVNLGLSVRNAPKAIDASVLDVQWVGEQDEGLCLVLDDLPMTGELRVAQQLVRVAESLALTSIRQGDLVYHPDAVSDDDLVLGDSFRFRVIDPAGHTIVADHFHIRRF